MAWIESHQELRDHPKTKRLCRALALPRPMVVGYLHFLWWWAYDYAPEGDLSSFTDEDLADAVDWEGDPSAFVQALVDTGFIDENRHLHDWDDFAQKWIERRQADRERKRAKRHKADDVVQPSGGCPPEIHSLSGVTVPDHTGPNLTGPDVLASLVDELVADAPPKPKRGSKAARTMPPETLEPNAADYAAGSEVGLTADEVDSKAAEMLDHWRAKGELRADWHASLRTWLRNSQKFDGPRGSPGAGNGHPRRPPNGPGRPPIASTTSELLQGRNGPIPRR